MCTRQKTIKAQNGQILTDDEKIKERWKNSFKTLMNEKSEREEWTLLADCEEEIILKKER